MRFKRLNLIAVDKRKKPICPTHTIAKLRQFVTIRKHRLLTLCVHEVIIVGVIRATDCSSSLNYMYSKLHGPTLFC